MRPSAAWRPLLLLAGGLAALLIALSARYGYHRDELYYLVIGGHPAFGYVDQPPLVPLLAHGLDVIGGHSLVALRAPSALAGAATTVLAGLIAKEFGSDRRGQLFAAACMATSGVLLGISHLMSTTTFDVLLWAAITLAVLRAVGAGGWRWLVVGGLAGLALEVKTLPAFLLAALLVGILAVGPRQTLASPWFAGGVVLAVALWLPNLVWQATHHWPQLELARAIASGSSGSSQSRAMFLPTLLLQVGPPLAPFWITGVVRLLREQRWRWLGVAWVLLLAFFLATAAKPYYLAGTLPLLFGACAGPVLRWARGRRRLWLPAALVVSFLPSAVITLPVVPVGTLHSTPIVAINSDAGETVGWPRFAATVASVARRARAPVLTANYGEAGALSRFAPGVRFFSGHNSLWDVTRPTGSTVVAVGYDRDSLDKWFATVRQAARIDNGVGVDNDEQGEPVWICAGPRLPWSRLWPQLRHLG